MLLTRRTKTTLINMALLLIGIGFLSWWNGQLILKDLHRVRTEDINMYRNDVTMAQHREEELQKVLSKVDDSNKDIKIVLQRLNIEEEQINRKEWVSNMKIYAVLMEIIGKLDKREASTTQPNLED